MKIMNIFAAAAVTAALLVGCGANAYSNADMEVASVDSTNSLEDNAGGEGGGHINVRSS